MQLKNILNYKFFLIFIFKCFKILKLIYQIEIYYDNNL